MSRSVIPSYCESTIRLVPVLSNHLVEPTGKGTEQTTNRLMAMFCRSAR